MKKYTWLLTLILSTTLLGACATFPDKKIAMVMPALEVKPPVESQVSLVRSIAESEVKPGRCVKLNEKWKMDYKWKDAIEACTACLKARDLNKVEEIAEELSRRELANPWGPYYLAIVARLQDHLERANWMVEMSLKRAPQSGLVHYLRGQILWDQKLYDPAVIAFEKSVQFDDSIVSAHMILGEVYYRDQDFKGAIPHFAKVLDKDSKNKIAWQGTAQSQLELKNYNEAFAAFDRLNDLDAHDGYYLGQMAEIQENAMHKPEEALDLYVKLSKRMKSGMIEKNSDDQIEMKIKRLQAQVNKARVVANVKPEAASVEKRKEK